MQRSLFVSVVSFCLCSTAAQAETNLIACLDKLKQSRAGATAADSLMACLQLQIREPKSAEALKCRETEFGVPPGVEISDATAAAAKILDADDNTKATLRAHVAKGTAAMSSGTPEDALPEFNAALKLNPRSIDALWGRAQAYERLKQPKSSVIDYATVVDARAVNKQEEDIQEKACARLAELDK